MGIETALALGAGLAATAAGSAMSASAQKRAGQDQLAMADARNKQLQEYRDRMLKIREDAEANNKKTQELYNPEQSKAREDEAEAKLNTQYTAATTEAPPMATPATGGSAPTVVDDARAKAKAGNDQYTAMLAKRLAALGTQPQSLLGSGIQLGRAGSLNDQYVNFGKQETSLLPQYQDFASTYYKLKPPPSSPGGQALTGLGGTLFKLAGSSFG